MYEVVIEAEACVLYCEVTNLVDEPAHLTTWASDREGLGYRELEFRAPSGKWFDPEGNSHNLGRNGCAEIADRYAVFLSSFTGHRLSWTVRPRSARKPSTIG